MTDLAKRLRELANSCNNPHLYEKERTMLEAAEFIEAERAKPTKQMTPTAAQIELAKDAVAFLDLNGMHLAAGVVRRYVLKDE